MDEGALLGVDCDREGSTDGEDLEGALAENEAVVASESDVDEGPGSD